MIGPRIKAIRKSKKMTQDDLAKKIGVQRAVISKYENSNIEPSLSQIKKIANAMGVSVSYITGDKFDDFNLSLGLSLKIGRMQSGYSVEDISKALGIACQTIYDYEEYRAKPTPEIIKSLCSFLGLNYDLLMETEDKGPRFEFTPDDMDTYSSFVENGPEYAMPWAPDKAAKLLFLFRFLNEAGKDRAIEDILNLTQVKKYAHADRHFEED